MIVNQNKIEKIEIKNKTGLKTFLGDFYEERERLLWNMSAVCVGKMQKRKLQS